MKIVFCVMLLAVWSNLCFTQEQRVIDSLMHELPKNRQDTSRALLMDLIAYNYRNNNLDSAVSYAQKTLELSTKIDFAKGTALALNRLAHSSRFSGNLSKSLDLSYKALLLAEKHFLEEEKAIILSEIAYIYSDLEDHQTAFTYHKKAKAIIEKINLSDKRRYCFNLLMIGIQFAITDQPDSANYYFQKSLEAYQVNKIEVSPQVYEELGNVQFKLGNMPLALSYYQKSLQALTPSINYFSLSKTLLALSKYYQKINQLDSSIFYAQKSLGAAQLISSKNKRIGPAAIQLSKLYETINTDEAFRYYKIAVEIQDSLYGKNSLESIQTIAAQEEERKRAIEANRTKYEYQLKQYGLLTGLGVFLLLAFILYQNNKKQKAANRLLHQQKEEINQKSQQLEISLSTLKSTQAQLIQSEKMASLGELTAGIAHEIQNPLNFVNNFSEVSNELIKEMQDELKKGNVEEGCLIADDIEQNLVKINHHGLRASSIVKGMLDHSRTSIGVKELIDISALADEFLRLSYQGIRAKDNNFYATLETHFDPDLPLISLIHQDFGRVLLNLINNAFYAVNEKAKLGMEDYQPTVTISTRKLENAIEINVKDNGKGIPESIREKIFQPFFTTKPTGQGTGLGLSLSYDIVKAHGGHIEIKSNYCSPSGPPGGISDVPSVDEGNTDPFGRGSGSEFIIFLPIKTNG